MYVWCLITIVIVITLILFSMKSMLKPSMKSMLKRKRMMMMMTMVMRHQKKALRSEGTMPPRIRVKMAMAIVM